MCWQWAGRKTASVSYLCEEDIEDANVVMEIDYVQSECNEKYDICNNPEEFVLYVDGEAIN